MPKKLRSLKPTELTIWNIYSKPVTFYVERGVLRSKHTSETLLFNANELQKLNKLVRVN